MKKIFLLLVLWTSSVTVRSQNVKHILPTKPQIEWSEAEIGVMYHLDMQVFEPTYLFREDWNYQPDVSKFNPTELDTDQWLKSAKAAGAKYAVLVAKHCSGFSLWPTSAHDYSVKNVPWKNGKGDIVKDFIASCKKYGIKPGLYASASVNAYFQVNNPGRVLSGNQEDQEKYKQIVRTQLTELWTQYGELFEIWFDGGVLPPDKGGIEMLSLLKKYQPKAAAFQGPYGYENNIRWVGNENGVAPYPCWSQADSTTSATGLIQIKGLNGSPDGAFWCPGEADFPLRKHAFLGGWFWKEGEEDKIRSLEDLKSRYNETVGRNTNMLLGVVVDDRGLVPDADVNRLKEFGDQVDKRFSKLLGSTSGKGLNTLTVQFAKPQNIRDVIIQEDIALGQRVREYALYGQRKGDWQRIAEGSSIGHKRIESLQEGDFDAIKLVIEKSAGSPMIKNLACY
ncbi:alpha-L-fucosidase [Dyadobacter jejuensis]|uniref:alpha-L-fucosidase n=1 Tax=Dyadobacter jejuensis TaxID=1082580 RepID=A0A316AJF3_9BACT|nr:alpha-L-fucosidase [Dyadobacter jejuensis]PWJ57945.1 alpha-L-fucosidase [Dyadobacter jejuensis]